MCLSSGFASTYFERVLKKHERVESNSSDRRPSTSIEESKVVFDADDDDRQDQAEAKPSKYPEESPSPYTSWQSELANQKPGLWVRNVQLSMFAFVISLVMFIFETNQEAFKALGDQILGSSQWWWDATDGVSPNQDVTSSITWRPAAFWIADFFEGFTAIAWFIVCLQITGGLLAALVIKVCTFHFLSA